MLNKIMNKEEIKKEIVNINMWYMEQVDRYNRGEIKESTMKSYRSKHRQKRHALITNMKKIASEQIKEVKKSSGLFAKW